jgi:hypothetical protein
VSIGAKRKSSVHPLALRRRSSTVTADRALNMSSVLQIGRLLPLDQALENSPP